MALVAASAVALVAGALVVSFASAPGKVVGPALVLGALAGFVQAAWLATGRPRQHGTAVPRRPARVGSRR